MHVDLRAVDGQRPALEAALSEWVSGEPPTVPPVVLIDSFERSDDLDRWLRDQLIAELPAGSVVVVAGRRPPLLAWRSDPLWSAALDMVPLRALPVPDAGALLDRLGVSSAAHPDAIRLAGGHPLALSLLAQLLANSDSPEVPTELVAAPGLVAGLLAHLLDDVPSEPHRRALEVSALARVTNRSLRDQPRHQVLPPRPTAVAARTGSMRQGTSSTCTAPARC